MSLQSSINGVMNSALGAAASLKVNDIANAAQKEEKAAKVANKSYGNELNKILGEAISNNPEFKDPDMFNKAPDMMEGKKSMMMAQREATRAYRNQYAKGSEEYKAIDSEGDARKAANFQDFRESLRQLRKGGSNGKY